MLTEMYWDTIMAAGRMQSVMVCHMQMCMLILRSCLMRRDWKHIGEQMDTNCLCWVEKVTKTLKMQVPEFHYFIMSGLGGKQRTHALY